MIIHGRFIGSAPYFAVEVEFGRSREVLWFLADTGAERTTLLEQDASVLGLSSADLEPAPSLIVGIGGTVRAFVARGARLLFRSRDTHIEFRQDLLVVRHDPAQLPLKEAVRMRRIPSLLGRDLLGHFCLTCDPRAGILQLERRD